MATLFLDDSQSRLEWAQAELPFRDALFLAETAQGAIEYLEHPSLFDEVYLGHDLGGETYVDSVIKNCGMEVVRWICEHKPKIGKIVVHSMNAPAGNEMVAKLRGAGYDAEYLWFIGLMKRFDAT